MSVRQSSRDETSVRETSVDETSVRRSIPLLTLTLPTPTDAPFFLNFPTVEPTRDQQHFDAWTKELFGNEVIAKIYNSVRSNHVLTVGKDHLLSELDASVENIGGRSWWQRFVNYHHSDRGNHDSRLIGKGMWNEAHSVDYVEERFTSNDNFERLFGVQPPAKLVMRLGSKPTSKREVISEFILTAFASYHKIGPRNFIMFFWDERLHNSADYGLNSSGLYKAPDAAETRRPPSVPTSQARLDKRKCAMEAMEEIQETVYISEAWQGDCTAIVVPSNYSRQVLPGEFAPVFVRLVKEVAAKGLFHGDLKRANLLYRKKGSDLELAFTDFDGYFCKLVPTAALTPSLRRCLEVITIVCFLAEIRCHYSESVHEEYAKAIQQSMQDEGIKMFEVEQHGTSDIMRYKKYPDVNDYCFWIRLFHTDTKLQVWNGRVLESTQTKDKFKHEEELAKALEQHISNYFIRNPDVKDPTFQDGSTHNRVCFKLDSKLPLAYQLMKFAFTA